MPFAQLVRHVLDFCYPGTCANCRATCAGDALVCDVCDHALDTLARGAACMRCAMPLVQNGDPCPWCRGKGLYPFEQIVRLGIFDDPLKDLIHTMKYQKRWTLAEHLADRLASLDRVKQLVHKDSILIPMPLHFIRQVKRGYNQAEILARRLRSDLKCHIAFPARRIRNTATQTTIHAQAERVENVRNAFALTRGGTAKIAGKHLVLIDDVMTTGATLRSLARTLLPAKPASISAIVIAIADPRRRDFQQI